MTTDEARELFSYGSWATARMFSAAEALAPNALDAAATSSFPSIRATLAHIVEAEWIWLRRWRGQSPTSVPPSAGERSLAELKGELAAVEAERTAWFAQLADADLGGVVSYSGMDGKSFSRQLGKLIRHVVNHSTYHRGQLAAQLRQLGQTPPSADFTRYLRELG